MRSPARARVSDPWFCAYLDDESAVLGPSYDALARLDWTAEEAQADVVVELETSSPRSPGWREPVPARVVGAGEGRVLVGSELGLRLVADPDATFNGTLISVLHGERWRVCGHLGNDGTVLPGDGTRRLSPGRRSADARDSLMFGDRPRAPGFCRHLRNAAMAWREGS
jgi:hypothetical protein